MKLVRNESGQIILILLLIITVALGVGLSVIQRSITDISSSSKVEHSSRAFSAAEAGIERVLGGGSVDSTVPLGNNSSIQEVSGITVPAPNQALEYFPISKEEIAQVWLANPETLVKYYDQSSIDVYWGTSGLEASNRAAIELNVVYFSGENYLSKKYLFDPSSARALSNGFVDVSANCNDSLTPIVTSQGANRKFYCYKRIDFTQTATEFVSPYTLILIRARLFYTSIPQPVVVAPIGTCPGCSVPPQINIYLSTGVSGDTQRTVKLSRQAKVVPFYFDYALFSAGDIIK